MRAEVELTHEDGSPGTLRDESGGLWRVFGDDACGHLAVEEILDYGGGPAMDTIKDAPTVGRQPCAVATWIADETLNLTRCSSRGENHIESSTFAVDFEGQFVATPSGWKQVD